MAHHQALLKVLTTPSKIASSLDWRRTSGAILNLDIHRDRIGMALASHPSFGEGSLTLQPLALASKGRVTPECKQQLASIVKDHKVCGVVVSWPLQEDTKRMGAACGRVLYTLEHLVEDSNIITPSRPFCLWHKQDLGYESTDDSITSKDEPDAFGRSPIYSKVPPSDKCIHKASEEQYQQDEKVLAAHVWDNFVRVHWPEWNRKQSRQSPPVLERSRWSNSRSNDFHETDKEDAANYIHAIAL